MNRPFYVHTPQNIFGESLVSPHNSAVYSIKNCLTPAPRPEVKTMGKDQREAEAEARRMNDAHEAEMAAIFI